MTVQPCPGATRVVKLTSALRISHLLDEKLSFAKARIFSQIRASSRERLAFGSVRLPQKIHPVAETAANPITRSMNRGDSIDASRSKVVQAQSSMRFGKWLQ